jgi:thiosulfate dehydrogenase [quinone] large subunit
MAMTLPSKPVRMPTPAVVVARPAAYALASARLVLGLIFLWAFLDKLLGLGFATKSANAWVKGGHPTQGYLSSSFGPLGSMFKGMAGEPVVDVLFMAGLLAIGLTMTLGIAVRLGGWGGFAMVLLMYASHPVPWMQPHGSHPFLDEHILEAAVFALIAMTDAGHTLGLGRWWQARVKGRTWLE